MNKKIKILVDDKEIDYYAFADVIRDGDYFYKENDEWYLHKKQIIEEDKKIKKIEKLYKYIDKEVDEKEKDLYYENILKVYGDSEYEIDESISFIVDKINEIIDYLEEKE